MVRNRLLLVMLLLAGGVQANVLPPGTYPFRTYGSESGLGSLAAMRLAQDTDGYLWVATQDGAYRYNGTTFERFGLQQGLPSTFISSLRAMPDGSVWVGTAAGTARFDGKRFEVVSALPRVAPNDISGDDANQLYVALPQGLVMRAATGGLAIVAGWPAGREATGVWCDKNSDVWAATQGAVGRLSLGTWTWWTITPRERIDGIVVDTDRRVWARSGNHLWSKGASEAAFADVSSALPATSNNGYLCLDARRNLWVPTDAGVAIHDQHGWRVIGQHEGLPTEWARDVLEDREGSVWIASLGVHRMLGRGELVSYKRSNGLPNEVTWCFLWDREGHLLVGTDAGLARSTNNGWSVVPGTERMQIRTVVADEARPPRQERIPGTAASSPSAGQVFWASGSPAIIVRLDARGVKRYGEGEGVVARAVLALLRDHDGAIWAATRGGGLLRKGQDEDRFRRVDLPRGRPNEDIRTIMEDREGRVWAGAEEGLACLAHGRWTRFGVPEGFARNYVSLVRQTRRGDFWSAYFEPIGVVRFIAEERGGQVVLRLVQRIAYTNRVYLLGEDARGRLWVGTGSGVEVFDAHQTAHISSTDGLAGDDTDAQAFYCDSDGDIFIGTSSGFSHYFARADQPHLDPPPVRLTSVEAGPRHGFSASFSALSYFKPDIVEYEARMAGLDDAWQRVAEPRARWSALPPGDYRFEARARLRPGAWSQPATYDLVIAPAWWQTRWARALGVLLFVALVWLAFRGRVALLRRRNRELEALVEQRTKQLAELTVTDALTGMKNRRYLQLCMPDYTRDALRKHEVLARNGNGAERENADLIFFLLDLDWFKDVNDRFGHMAGDEVLVGLSGLLARTMRENDTLVRWGGEEFLFIARNATRAEAPMIAERMRVAVEGHEFHTGDTIVRLTCSIGFTAFPFLRGDRQRFSWEDVVDIADVCLYAAKRAGRDCWVGVEARHSARTETLAMRIRQSIAGVVAAGELEVLTSRAPIVHWPERRSVG
jgi:diguanylate cyclase (GGDEF)-like protein